MQSPIEQTKIIARELLESGRVAGVLALISEEGRIRPGFLKTMEEVDSLVVEPRYLLAPLARTIQATDSQVTFGIVARGCDERALVELAKAEQVDLGRMVLIGLACNEEIARRCGCRQPYPRKIDVGTKIDLTSAEKFSSTAEAKIDWPAELARCLKCYGCRNACPLCICPECKLAVPMWVQTGVVPPDPLSFHLIRAFHLVDKCVDCGSCEDACPAGLPLRKLHQHLLKMLEERLGYVPGMDADRQSPLFLDLWRTPFLDSKIPRWTSTLEENGSGEMKGE
jgi:ferredoxin